MIREWVKRGALLPRMPHVEVPLRLSGVRWAGTRPCPAEESRQVSVWTPRIAGLVDWTSVWGLEILLREVLI
jgi:hypothetical protein